ncbi:MAG: hypothetical protein A2285_10050 [Elusimicrobia bacterium RIFOXYA12_FULL_57_11]|nr:MAG: hypothetical protein A2285_10050 [Elusimicrobia bacterium RIFOXYA12_FULL_57_11]
MKKIALIALAYPADGLGREPGERWFDVMPPLWALALATYLRSAMPGVKVEIIDEQLLGRARFLQRLAAGRYELAGFSPVAYTYPAVLDCARLVKKNGAMVILGGHYAPALKNEILGARGPGSSDYCIDAIVRYDGEKPLHALVSGTPFSGVKNLVYPGPGGKIIENPVAPLDLAKLPPADYTLVSLEAYFRLQPAHSRGTLPFASQRGCKWAEGPGRCIFCSIQSTGGLRAIAPAAAALRMADLAKLGARYIFEGSDDFPADQAWLKEFASRAAGLKFPALRLFARASTLNQANVALLKAANARYVSVGVESMSDAVLRCVGKGASAALNRRAIALLLKAGILPKIHVILGLPGETRATFSAGFAEFKKMELPVESPEPVLLTSTFAVYPGTEAWRRLLAREPGYRGRDIVDEKVLFRAWLKHFSRLTEGDIDSARAALERLFAARVRVPGARRDKP